MCTPHIRFVAQSVRHWTEENHMRPMLASIGTVLCMMAAALLLGFEPFGQLTQGESSIVQIVLMVLAFVMIGLSEVIAKLSKIQLYLALIVVQNGDKKQQGVDVN